MTAYTFNFANVDTSEGTQVVTVLNAGSLTFFCHLYFDTDEISSTYNHWICTLEPVDDDSDIAERSFVIYPNTMHFVGDDLYVVTITSDLTYIGIEDLPEVLIHIGVINE